MLFHEKLAFLMNITNTNNKVLSQSIHVDPSLISVLRSGKRSMPKNKVYILEMANYFSRHLTTAYQIQAIEQYTGPLDYASDQKDDYLSNVIYKWFCDSSDTPPVDKESTHNHTIDVHPQSMNSPQYNVHVYYENEGKRNAMKHFFTHVENLSSPVTVFASTDEDFTWFTEDKQFHEYFGKKIKSLIDKGFHFVKILSSEEFENSLEVSPQVWLSSYMDECVTTYYYPRLRDSVHRATLFYVPDHIALYCHSIAGQTNSSPSMLYFSKEVILYEKRIFDNYLKQCIPIVKKYILPHDIATTVRRVFYRDAPQIYIGPTLSYASLPKKLMEEQRKIYPISHIMNSVYEFTNASSESEAITYIDIAPLADIEDIMNERVAISFPNLDIPYGTLCYTPSQYRMHLEYIIYLLDTMPNYHFVPYNGKTNLPEFVLAKLGKAVLCVNPSTSNTVYEFEHPDIISYLYEYLFHIAQRKGLTRQGEVRKCLVELIEEIKNRTR